MARERFSLSYWTAKVCLAVRLFLMIFFHQSTSDEEEQKSAANDGGKHCGWGGLGSLQTDRKYRFQQYRSLLFLLRSSSFPSPSDRSRRQTLRKMHLLSWPPASVLRHDGLGIRQTVFDFVKIS